uniref:Uncharacterized protein n=1 Tax=Schizaphis graminum TaxID=13262 RepID=A0A2S2NH10_SCHGA
MQYLADGSCEIARVLTACWVGTASLLIAPIFINAMAFGSAWKTPTPHRVETWPRWRNVRRRWGKPNDVTRERPSAARRLLTSSAYQVVSSPCICHRFHRLLPQLVVTYDSTTTW